MLINIWSTPRTGSVWYTHHLKKDNQDAIGLFGLFEKFQNSTYKIKNENGKGRYISSYTEGAFYVEYYLDDFGFIRERKIYSPRERTPEQEENRHHELLKTFNPSQLVIVNNHVPMRKVIMDDLISVSDRNIWIYRKNKRDQLSSWIIALQTGTFTIYDKSHISTEPVPDCSLTVFDNLMKRIKYWDDYPKENHEVIAFEDLNFYDGPGFPVDGNVNSWERISPMMQDYINLLVEQYYDEVGEIV